MANKNIDGLQRKVERLRLEVAAYKRKEALWQERWQRIAFNISQNGMQLHKTDCDVSAEDLQRLAKGDASNILKAFDVEIPKTGRV